MHAQHHRLNIILAPLKMILDIHHGTLGSPWAQNYVNAEPHSVSMNRVSCEDERKAHWDETF